MLTFEIPKKLKNTLLDIIKINNLNPRNFSSRNLFKENEHIFVIKYKLIEKISFTIIKHTSYDCYKLIYFKYEGQNNISKEISLPLLEDIKDNYFLIINEFENWLGITLDQDSPENGIKLFLSEKKEIESNEKIEDLWEQIDDPVLNSYKKEIYSEFEIIDEDAEYAPFNLKQQLFLDEYLEKLENRLEKEKKINKEQAKEIDEIKIDIKELRKEIPRNSKKKNINKLSFILAKVRKVSLIVLKEVYIAVRQELIGMLIKGLIA